ncbi:MAG: protein kinase domain-containing protein [Micromonosporaceae bacterium]
MKCDGSSAASEPLGRLQAALAKRYVIDRELGSGGMAVVYLAQDRRYGRSVAVKVLRQEVSSLLGVDRFLREIRTTANLQHPHILPLLDSGDADGQPYYVMPHVAGGSLRERLEREGPLSVVDVLKTAAQVGAALDYAHRRGAIHRDIKPENVLLQDGVAVVADFGLAIALSAEDRLTQTGLIVGTPAYMSPEQASGDVLDGRSDEYALGCLVYELLTGEPPFRGPSAQAVLAAHVTAAPPIAVVSPRGSVPQPLAAAVLRALAKRPDDRFPSVAAFLAALGDSGSALPRTTIQSVAVLPFRSLGGSEDDTLLADGLAEEVAVDLAKVKALRVIGRQSAARYKNADVDTRVIARELGSRYVLDGALRRAGAALRVTAQLTDGLTGETLWADRFGGSLDDVFAAQEQLARRIVESLRVALTPDERRRIARRSIQSAEARALYLRARQYNLQFTREALTRAEALLERAIALEPSAAPLYASMANVHWNYGNVGVRDLAAAVERARGLVERALQLDDENADAHVVLALLDVKASEPDSVAIIASLRRAHDLSPSSDCCMWLAVYLSQVGFPDAAEPFAREGAELDPLTPIVHLAGAFPEMLQGRFDEGLRILRHAVTLDPSDAVTRLFAAQLTAVAGRFDEARVVLEGVPAGLPSAWSGWADAYRASLSGDAARLRVAVADPTIVATVATDDQFAWLMADACAHAGLWDTALGFLETAVRRGFTNWRFLAEIDRLLVGLRNQPRFVSLIEDAKRRQTAVQTRLATSPSASSAS